jgi:hypothetical protein
VRATSYFKVEVLYLISPFETAGLSPVVPTGRSNDPVTELPTKPDTARLVAAATPKTGVTRVGLVLSTLATVPVDVVTPVPPFATASVPATVTTPDVAPDGVSPVVPKPIVVTPPPEADNVPADNDNPVPTVISSAAPVDAVVLPNSLAVAIVRPLAEAYALGAT